MKRKTLQGSLLPGHEPLSVDDAAEREVTLFVRTNPTTESTLAGHLAQVQRDPLSFKPLSFNAFARLVAASADDVSQVSKEVSAIHGISVVGVDKLRRQVVIQGSPRAHERLFDVKLGQGRGGRNYAGELSLPAPVAERVSMVAGLRHLPSHFSWQTLQESSPEPAFRPQGSRKQPRGLTRARYTPQQIARLYGFPPRADGSGQGIVVLQQPGGFLEADMKAYFSKLKLPEPRFRVRGENTPAPAEWVADAVEWLCGPLMLQPANKNVLSASGTFEATQVLQTVGAFAPGAEIQTVFISSGSFDAFLKELWNVLVARRNVPAVVTGSFGFRESQLSQLEALMLELTLSLFALRGITLVFPTGNSGPYSVPYMGDGMPESIPPLDVLAPASSPHVLGIGGTRLWSKGERILREVAFSKPLGKPIGQTASGGGFSRFNSLPYWQAPSVSRWCAQMGTEPVSGRGVPDVSLNAHMFSGWSVLAGGVNGIAMGTSSAAPLMASFILRLNQVLGRRLGYLTPLLYEPEVSRTFFDVVDGNSDITGNAGSYDAGPGWDPVTGLGALRGEALVETLRGRLEPWDTEG